MIEYFNADITDIIDDVVHNEVHRRLLKRRYVDGVTFSKLAEEFGYSERQIYRIVSKERDKIINYIKRQI